MEAALDAAIVGRDEARVIMWAAVIERDDLQVSVLNLQEELRLLRRRVSGLEESYRNREELEARNQATWDTYWALRR